MLFARIYYAAFNLAASVGGIWVWEQLGQQTGSQWWIYLVLGFLSVPCMFILSAIIFRLFFPQGHSP
jgi:hypothetical protein